MLQNGDAQNRGPLHRPLRRSAVLYPRPLDKTPPCGQCVAAKLCPLRETAGPRPLQLRPQQQVMREGEGDSPVFIVKQGLLGLRQLGPDGRERPIAILGAGCLIGQSGVLGLTALVSAEAITPAAVCTQTPQRMAERMREDSATAHLFGQQTRTLFMALAAWSHLLRLPSLRQRLAAALLQLAAQQGHAALMLPRQVLLAELLGVARESVSRAWQELLEHGLVHRLAPGNYAIDIHRLRQRLDQRP